MQFMAVKKSRNVYDLVICSYLKTRGLRAVKNDATLNTRYESGTVCQQKLSKMVVWMGTGGTGPSGLPWALSQQSGGEDQVLIKNCGVIKLLGYVFAE